MDSSRFSRHLGLDTLFDIAYARGLWAGGLAGCAENTARPAELRHGWGERGPTLDFRALLRRLLGRSASFREIASITSALRSCRRADCWHRQLVAARLCGLYAVSNTNECWDPIFPSRVRGGGLISSMANRNRRSRPLLRREARRCALLVERQGDPPSAGCGGVGEHPRDPQEDGWADISSCGRVRGTRYRGHAGPGPPPASLASVFPLFSSFSRTGRPPQGSRVVMQKNP